MPLRKYEKKTSEILSDLKVDLKKWVEKWVLHKKTSGSDNEKFIGCVLVYTRLSSLDCRCLITNS